MYRRHRSVYARSEDAPANERLLVKNGFSWPAFFFGPIWAWVKGMTGVGFGLLFARIMIVLSQVCFVELLVHVKPPVLAGAIEVLVLSEVLWALYVGAMGNHWRRRNLERAGYVVLVDGARAT